jgi:hypothetical protein
VAAEIRERVAEKSRYRCGYCLTSQLASGSKMQMDHLQPYSAGGATNEFNLWLACVDCNSARSNRIAGVDPVEMSIAALFNPRDNRWTDHFEWAEGGIFIVGRTPIGRATVAALNLNREHLVSSRAEWIRVGWHPPTE